MFKFLSVKEHSEKFKRMKTPGNKIQFIAKKLCVIDKNLLSDLINCSIESS